MTRREVVRRALEHRRPPYVPWSFGFTQEAREKLQAHFGSPTTLDEPLGNHLLKLGSDIGFFEPVGRRAACATCSAWSGTARVDKDIGNVEGCVLPQPTLARLRASRPAGRRASSPTSPASSRGTPTASACSRSASRCTSGRGPCGAWRT